jgi:hypothetical protein
MPGDVTVHRPHTGIIELDLYNEIALGPHELDIATLRVAGVDDGAVPLSDSLVKYEEVMSVYMERVMRTDLAFPMLKTLFDWVKVSMSTVYGHCSTRVPW